ncbi:alpha/beta hydrolase [Methanofollis formosanus]|uniref:Alpha/beta hydrolase n=1 Tax=Methanofollis formosanus TaxID=299308 RepID=A0A8G1EGA8_9EURY|nr:alpha/beta hydrolase [Methanofollis formosanus]QYZ79605.1 alpha/beta hydrolase [Methanofollis formosanus]
MICPVGADDLLLVRGPSSFLLVGEVHERFALCIETKDDEYCEGLHPGDLVCVSAPEGGSLRAAAMILLLVRDHHFPVVALPRGHPGSRRIPMVVSAAPTVTLSCEIARGTHPDQHLICGSAELAGLTLRGGVGTVTLDALPPTCTISYICVDRALVEE